MDSHLFSVFSSWVSLLMGCGGSDEVQHSCFGSAGPVTGWSLLLLLLLRCAVAAAAGTLMLITNTLFGGTWP